MVREVIIIIIIISNNNNNNRVYVKRYNECGT